MTCDALTNPVPVTVSEKLPIGIAAGDTPLTVGIGFSTVTLLLPFNAVFAALVAVTLIGLGEGSAVGAVYKPALVIWPTPELPPATPLTAHVTDWLIEAPAVPVAATVAENCWVAPARTLAAAGLTLTPFEGFGFVPLLLDTAPQPVRIAVASHSPRLDTSNCFRHAILNIAAPCAPKFRTFCARAKVEHVSKWQQVPRGNSDALTSGPLTRAEKPRPARRFRKSPVRFLRRGSCTLVRVRFATSAFTHPHLSPQLPPAHDVGQHPPLSLTMKNS